MTDIRPVSEALNLPNRLRPYAGTMTAQWKRSGITTLTAGAGGATITGAGW